MLLVCKYKLPLTCPQNISEFSCLYQTFKHKPSLIPCFQLGAHLMKISPTAATVDNNVTTQLNLKINIGMNIISAGRLTIFLPDVPQSQYDV